MAPIWTTNQAILILQRIKFKGIEIMSEAQMNGMPSPAAQTIFTNDSRVACNGGGGPLGHPQVWLTLGSGGQVTCPYCSRRFAPLPTN